MDRGRCCSFSDVSIFVTQDTQAQVRPCIEKLNNDSDVDVRYYASEAAMGESKYD